MSFAKVQELRQKKAELYRESKALIDSAEAESRNMTADESAKWEKLHGELEELSVRIDRIEQQDAAADSLSKLDLDVENRGSDRKPESRTGFDAARSRFDLDVRDQALASWLLGRQDHAEACGVVDACRELGFDFRSTTYGRLPGKDKTEGKRDGYTLFSRAELRRFARAGGFEQRAPMDTTAGSAGGDFIPEGFVPRVEVARVAFGGMRTSGAEILRTTGGGDLPYPTADDTSNKGQLIGESTAVSEQNISTSALVLGAFKYSSDLVLIPIELLEDSGIDVESFVAERVGVRLARIENEHFTTGDGSSKPNGVMTAAAAGVTFASNSAIAMDEVLDLKHSVDPAYRAQGARFMFNDSTLLALKKLTIASGDDRPLWMPGLRDGEPNTIDGDPYTINQDVASIGSSARSMAYGAFRYYKIRDVRGMRLLVLRERYADADQIGVFAFMRTDGDLIDTAAVKRGTHVA